MVNSRSVSPEKGVIKLRREATIILVKEPTKISQSITLHWENINVHTPDTAKTLCNKIRKKNLESNSRHIIKDGSFCLF